MRSSTESCEHTPEEKFAGDRVAPSLSGETGGGCVVDRKREGNELAFGDCFRETIAGIATPVASSAASGGASAPPEVIVPVVKEEV